PNLYTLSLHDALPILYILKNLRNFNFPLTIIHFVKTNTQNLLRNFSSKKTKAPISIFDSTFSGSIDLENIQKIKDLFSNIQYFIDRKSTRLNSSHSQI